MNREIYSDRWLTWTIVCIVVVGVSMWGFLKYAEAEIDFDVVDDSVEITIVINKRLKNIESWAKLRVCPDEWIDNQMPGVFSKDHVKKFRESV